MTKEILAASTDFNLKFIDPEKITSDLNIEAGMKIADFGCGTGYFTFPMAKKVGSDGVVYALDILKEKIENISSQAKLLGLNNIVTKRVNLEREKGSGLASSSLDWVLLVNVLFQNKNKDAIIQEAKRVLKNQGKILVIEWQPLDSSIGPDKKLRISQEELVTILDRNNLGIISEPTIGHFHYGLVLVK